MNQRASIELVATLSLFFSSNFMAASLCRVSLVKQFLSCSLQAFMSCFRAWKCVSTASRSCEVNKGCHQYCVLHPKKTNLSYNSRLLLTFLCIEGHLVLEGGNGLLEFMQLSHLPRDGVWWLFILLLESFKSKFPLFSIGLIEFGFSLEL